MSRRPRPAKIDLYSRTAWYTIPSDFLTKFIVTEAQKLLSVTSCTVGAVCPSSRATTPLGKELRPFEETFFPETSARPRPVAPGTKVSAPIPSSASSRSLYA